MDQSGEATSLRESDGPTAPAAAPVESPDEQDCDRIIIPRRAPGFGWLAAIVTVSLGLWAGLIWLGIRVVSWLG